MSCGFQMVRQKGTSVGTLRCLLGFCLSSWCDSWERVCGQLITTCCHCLAVNQGLFVSVDRCANFTTELVGPNSPGSVTSLALHGSLLALGFSHGRLSLYGVPSPSDLVGLNISQPVWEKLLDDAAIITVGVAFDFTSLLPIVVAASAYCIFIIRWD